MAEAIGHPSTSKRDETRKHATVSQTPVRSVPLKMERSNKKVVIISSVGAVIAIIGIIVGIFWNTHLYDLAFLKLVVLSSTSTTYSMWQETPIPMYLKFYMFNWTNPHEFYSSSDVKPNFKEMGPYVFREIDYKVNRVWHDNGTVTFQRRKEWYFEESLSNGKLTDKVTNVNPVTATVAFYLKDKSAFIRQVMNKLLESLGEKLTFTKSVGTLIFDGYNDTVLHIAQKFNATTIPWDKFAWFFARNGSDSYDGTFNMFTGSDDIYSMGVLTEWNYSNRTNYYKDLCGMIKGTLGDYGPPLPDNSTLPIFIPDICTSLTLSYADTTTFQDITGKKYIGNKDMLDNGENVPSRRCYCPNGNCEPSGILGISNCKFGAPAFVSMPHFYLADPSYRENITGMSPDKNKHDLMVVIEPTTGFPIQVKAQLQLNLLLEPVEHISMFENINKTYIPMLWFTQEANLTASLASQLKILLILPTLGNVTFFGIAGIGVLILLIGIFLRLRQKWREEESQVLISKSDGDVRNRSDI